MPPRLYDDSDADWHPVLVVRADPMLGMARVATRTTKPHARTTVWASHPVSSDLGFDTPGWWRLGRMHRVPFANFADPAAEFRGSLTDEDWAKVMSALRGTAL